MGLDRGRKASWSRRLWRHGAGLVAGRSPVSAEASARRQGAPQAVALLEFLAAVHADADRAVESAEFGSLGELCGFLLRPFPWLEAAVRAAAVQSGLAAAPRLARALATDRTLGPQPDPEPELELEPEPEPAALPVEVLARRFPVVLAARRPMDIFITHAQVGFGRIVVSATEAPNMLAIPL